MEEEVRWRDVRSRRGGEVSKAQPHLRRRMNPPSQHVNIGSITPGLHLSGLHTDNLFGESARLPVRCVLAMRLNKNKQHTENEAS